MEFQIEDRFSDDENNEKEDGAVQRHHYERSQNDGQMKNNDTSVGIFKAGSFFAHFVKFLPDEIGKKGNDMAQNQSPKGEAKMADR